MGFYEDSKKFAESSASQIVKDGFTRAEMEAHAMLDSMVDSATGALKMDKNFIHIREFYNFMRVGSGQNAPTPFFYFSPNFYNFSSDIDLDTGVTAEHAFFSKNIGEFARFRYCIQAISFPALSIRKSDPSAGALSNGQIDISNLFGGHSIIGNSFLTSDNHTLEMNILNTHKPVVENFIYPWLLEVIRSSYDNTSPIPRVNMAVKYWSPNHITRNMEGVKPDFVYYVTGLFPIKINTYKPIQTAQESALQRIVTFAFNDFIILNSESDALKYNLGEFFIGNFVHNVVDEVVKKGQDAVHKFISDIANKLRRDKKKKKKNNRPGNANTGLNVEKPNTGLTKADLENISLDSLKNLNLSNSGSSSDIKSLASISSSSSQTNSQTTKSQLTRSQLDASNQAPQTTNQNQLSSLNVQTASLQNEPMSSPTTTSQSYSNRIEQPTYSETPERNASSRDSNMSLDENVQMVNILNADDSLGEIIDAENEMDVAKENADAMSKSTRDIKAIKTSAGEIDVEDVMNASSNEPMNVSRNIDSSSTPPVAQYSSTPGSSVRPIFSSSSPITTSGSSGQNRQASINDLSNQTRGSLDHSSSLYSSKNYRNIGKSTIAQTPAALNADDSLGEIIDAENEMDVAKANVDLMVKASNKTNGSSINDLINDFTESGNTNKSRAGVGNATERSVGDLSEPINASTRTSSMNSSVKDNINNGIYEVHEPLVIKDGKLQPYIIPEKNAGEVVKESKAGNATERSVGDSYLNNDDKKYVKSNDSNMTLTKTIDMIENKNSDEYFSDIIKPVNKAENAVEMAQSNVIQKLRSSISSSNRQNSQEYDNIQSILTKDRIIDRSKYNILQNYATVKNLNVKTVLNEYKSINSDDDLNRFVSEVDSALTKNNQGSDIETKNGKIVPPVIQPRSESEITQIKEHSRKTVELKKTDSVNISHPIVVPRQELTENDIADLF